MKKNTFFYCLLVTWASHSIAIHAQQAPADQPAPAAQPVASGPETVETVEKIGVQGNWVKKRELLLKSNEVNTQIQELAGQTEAIRKSFIDRYTDIDSILDEYYKSIGLEQGKLQELFDDILRHLEKKRKKQVDVLNIAPNQEVDPELQSKIDIIEGSLNTSKEQLEQLKLDMKSIEDLDRSLEDRIKRVDETSNTITNEAARANDIIETLWSIIDHNKARDAFYDLSNNILEKIKSLQSYLSTDLTQDFDTVIQTVKDQIARTQDAIKKLESDGLFIKDRANRVKELRLKEVQSKQAEAKKTEAATPVTHEKPNAIVPWYTALYNYIAGVFKSIYNGLMIIKNAIVGVDKPKTAMTAVALPVIPTLPATSPTTDSSTPATPQS